MALLDQANIFPVECTSKRVFEHHNFWDLVKKPTAVGSQGDKDKETVRQSDAVEILFDVLTKPSENRDFEEYEFLTEGDDDD